MKALLDTSVCIGFLRRHGPTVERLMAFKSRDVFIPAHAVVELEHGVYLSQRRKQAREELERLFAKYRILPFEPAAARRAGRLMYELGRHGLTMKYFDLMIAAQALDSGATLATADADFECLSGARGLKLAMWAAL